MPGSRALPGWFSYLPCLWAAVLPASAGHSTLPPPTRAELLVLESRDILREPLNEAVNKEVSSLNLSDRPPQNSLTSGPPFCKPLPGSDSGHSQLLASSPAPCWPCCCSQGTCTARPSWAPHTWVQNQALPASCSQSTLCSLLWDGVCPLAGSRGRGAPSPQQ